MPLSAVFTSDSGSLSLIGLRRISGQPGYESCARGGTAPSPVEKGAAAPLPRSDDWVRQRCHQQGPRRRPKRSASAAAPVDVVRGTLMEFFVTPRSPTPRRAFTRRSSLRREAPSVGLVPWVKLVRLGIPVSLPGMPAALTQEDSALPRVVRRVAGLVLETRPSSTSAWRHAGSISKSARVVVCSCSRPSTREPSRRRSRSSAQ